jgi:hypothetical protein
MREARNENFRKKPVQEKQDKVENSKEIEKK